MFKQELLKVYFIAGSQDVPNKNLYTVLEEALKSGITMFQYREKGPNSKTGKDKETLAKQLFELCKKYNVRLIVNFHFDLNIKISDVKMHIRQDDINVKLFKDKIENIIIGLSVVNKKEFDLSDVSLVDYIGTGPIHSTLSK